MKKSRTSEKPDAPARFELDERTMEMMKLLMETIVDYVIIFLDTEGRVLTWSGAAERINGWKEDEIVGQDFSRFYTSEQIEQGKTGRELEAAARDGRFEAEVWRVRKDGSRFWANVVITALRGKDGKLQGFAKITRDLTQRRAIEEESKRQAAAILEMAVPIVQLWEGVLLVPLIGTFDSQRSQQLMERLLKRIVDTNSRVALLDITGVATMDTQTARYLIETTSAVGLVGAEVILTGVRPVIAQTMVLLGMDLPKVIARSTLAAGLRVALSSLNLGVTSTAKEQVAL